MKIKQSLEEKPDTIIHLFITPRPRVFIDGALANHIQGCDDALKREHMTTM